jgi:hypothetical protein
MRAFIKVSLLAILIMAFTIIMPGFMDNTNHTQAADEADWSEEIDNQDADAFTIIELVPYKGMAEIGYLIGGQEPIDPELIPYNSGVLSFLGDALNLYPSYREKPLATGQSPDNGWIRSSHYILQNGYFELQSQSGPDLYSISEGNTIYHAVTEGSGTHIARLPANITLENSYENIWNPIIHKKNVVAYFKHSSYGTADLYSNSIRYKPYSVTRVDDSSGDYDYDSENKIFYLNKGQGYYDVRFVPSGSGSYFMRNDYIIVEDNTGDYSYSGSLNYTASSGGNYIRITNAPLFSYQQWWGGMYKWVPSEEALSKPSNYYREGNRIWIKGYKALEDYQFTFEGEIVNNEWFKRMSLGIPSEQVKDFPVRVITLTPNQLNQPENQHYIDEASLFYINENYGHNQNYLLLYESYTHEGLALPSGSKYYNNENKKQADLNFAVNDLSWASVDKIFRRVAGIGQHKAAVILDYTFYSKAINGTGAYGQLRRDVNVGVSYTGQSASSCNMAKLFIMIYQRNMVDFYNAFMNSEKTSRLITSRAVNASINRSGSTGSYVRLGRNDAPDSNQALYWNGNTFLALGLNADGNLVSYGTNLNDTALKSYGINNYNLTATPTDLSDNVLIMNGQPIFTSTFAEPLYVPDNSDAVDHLNSLDPENPVNPGGITIGDFLNVITNNGEGYENTGGVAYPDGSDVEGPPEDETPPSSGDNPGGSNIRNYKRVLNIQPTADFMASQTAIETILSNYDIQIVNMTSTEFNGSITDINSNYDMIFMGSGSGRFNMQNQNHVVTTFNDNNYPARGNIYFADGDTVSSRGVTHRYRGNDISPDKKAKLESFLQAGYPIVLDDLLYRMVDPRGYVSVRTDTNIYSFIVNSKARTSNFLTMADYTSNNTRQTFNNRLNAALRIIRPNISLEQPLLPETPINYYTYVDQATNLLTIRFKLLPKGPSPSHHNYDAYVYLDKNGDGFFDASEEIPINSSDGSNWKNIRESSNRTFNCSINLSGLNGVRQWKILIERTDNRLIRGYITGYIANSNPEVISILQIMESSSSYNIEDSIIVNEDSLLRTYTRFDKLEDYRLNFTTMTVQEFEQLYVGNPYNSSNLEGTTKLSSYNMLLMDNPVTAINNANGAVTNIRDEIANKNLSVVFTKNALGYSDQGNYYSANKQSFLNNNTYNFINLDAKNGDDLIYRDMIGDFATNPRTANALISAYLTKTNEGSIARYPYQINNAIRIAQNSYSNWATDNFSEAKKLIGWYSLSDTGHPAVVEAGLAGSTPISSYMGTYSSSPNDVVNNYYLFSNGLCFYSGIVLSQADTNGNDNEIKLFVNTLIAAFRASTRVVSRPPIINVIDPTPLPDPDEGNRPTITVTTDNFDENNLILTFEIKESSSPMDLSILLDDIAEPSGDWDDTIYPSVLGVLGEPITINNTDKVVMNGTYAIKIPSDILIGTHKLTFKAFNANGNTASTDVWIKYTQLPVVTIKEPISESSSTMKYIYLDIDYNDLLDDEEYMDQAGYMEIIFSVNEALSDVSLRLESMGADIPIEDYRICAYDGTANRDPLDLSLYHPGDPETEYLLQLKMSLMINRNIREFKIIAKDTYGQEGSDSFTLLRRSLFPLD